MAKIARVWNGSAWVEILSNPAPYAYYQTTAPASPAEGDIWVDSDAETVNASGPQGETGATGATGATGPAATISVGTTTTGNAGTSATVTNSGTSSAAVFDFQIPRGNTGATGATGATGPAGANAYNIPITTQATSRDIALTDLGDMIECTSASAMTLTVRADATVTGFTNGDQIMILQSGAGQVTIAGNGATINGTPGLKLRAQWSSATLIKRGTNLWVLVGDTTA